MLKISAKTLEDLPTVSSRLLPYIHECRVLLLDGPMGAGKTTLVKQICKDLEVVDEVSSPTYSLVNEYLRKGGEKVFHFDFYRVKNLEEAYDMGAEEYLFSGDICLIEWPGVIVPLLPISYLVLKMIVQDDERHYTLLKSTE